VNQSSLAATRTESPSDAGHRADVVRFASGIPGFEACRGFVLVAAPVDGLQYLTSVEGPPSSFLVVDPRRVQAGYRCQLSDADRHALRAAEDDTLLWLAIVSVEADGSVVANLRAPIVINPAQMLGQQVIPFESLYPLRHVLLKA
jgi:flagellar assembly factor FliW